MSAADGPYLWKLIVDLYMRQQPPSHEQSRSIVFCTACSLQLAQSRRSKRRRGTSPINFGATCLWHVHTPICAEGNESQVCGWRLLWFYRVSASFRLQWRKVRSLSKNFAFPSTSMNQVSEPSKLSSGNGWAYNISSTF